MQQPEVAANGHEQREECCALHEATAAAAGKTTRRPSNSRDLLKIHQLIDLRDEPIRLKRDDICWRKVRASASNCICSCANSSITLVTTNDSYVLEHIPLDDIQAAEANASLAYLAMSNGRKLAIIDLVDENNLNFGASSRATSLGAAGPGQHSSKPRNSTKMVNLAGKGLAMIDVLLWRWIGEEALGILTREALFVCQVDQTRLSHPTSSAMLRSSQLLAIEKVCNLHPNLSRFCQITNIQRDESTNLYAITGHHTPAAYLSWQAAEPSLAARQVPSISTVGADRLASNPSSGSLKHSFSSVPGRLSQLVKNGHSFDSLPLVEKYTDLNHNGATPKPVVDDQVHGLLQIHCRIRGLSQLIRAHAATFATCRPQTSVTSATAGNSTTLIAANRSHDKLRIHLIGMATSSDLTTNGQNASPSMRLESLADANQFDYPVSIVCSTPQDATLADSNAKSLQMALVCTKYGQLFGCSIQYGTILFNVRITHDAISSTVLESKTGGLMVICSDGRVLLVQLHPDKLAQLLDESRSLRPVPSYSLLKTCNELDAARRSFQNRDGISASRQLSLESTSTGDQEEPPDIGQLDVLESTKL